MPPVMPAVAKSGDKRFQVTSEETVANLVPSPAKRPMNGFMLFAQKYRLQLIQQFPGRDNRFEEGVFISRVCKSYFKLMYAGPSVSCWGTLGNV